MRMVMPNGESAIALAGNVAINLKTLDWVLPNIAADEKLFFKTARLGQFWQDFKEKSERAEGDFQLNELGAIKIE